MIHLSILRYRIIFGIRCFEATIQDLTDVEKDKIDEIVASFQSLISECSEEIVERYNRAFDQYFQVRDEYHRIYIFKYLKLKFLITFF